MSCTNNIEKCQQSLLGLLVMTPRVHYLLQATQKPELAPWTSMFPADLSPFIFQPSAHVSKNRLILSAVHPRTFSMSLFYFRSALTTRAATMVLCNAEAVHIPQNH